MAEDSIFIRDGANIYVESNISFTQVRTRSVLHFHYFWMSNHLIKEEKDLNADITPIDMLEKSNIKSYRIQQIQQSFLTEYSKYSRKKVVHVSKKQLTCIYFSC